MSERKVLYVKRWMDLEDKVLVPLGEPLRELYIQSIPDGYSCEDVEGT